MKTLDEVIKAYEVCHASVLDCEGCPYDNGARYRDSDCYIADAIHYLREYQEMKKHLAVLDAHEIRGDVTQIINNPELTWTELEDMVGKPIWIVGIYQDGWRYDKGAWEMVRYIGKNQWLEDVCLETDTCLHRKEDLGETWKAYRKEKK